jgi:cysteine desulfurase
MCVASHGFVFTSLINGGGQERGMRSGTLSPPLCVGLGEACAIAKDEMASEYVRLTALARSVLSAIDSSRA